MIISYFKIISIHLLQTTMAVSLYYKIRYNKRLLGIDTIPIATPAITKQNKNLTRYVNKSGYKDTCLIEQQCIVHSESTAEVK